MPCTSRHRGALLGFRSSQAFQRVRATVSPYSCTRLTPTRIIDFAVRNLKKVYPLAVLRPCVDRARRTILCLIFEQTYLWCLFPANRARSLGTAVRDGEMSMEETPSPLARIRASASEAEGREFKSLRARHQSFSPSIQNYIARPRRFWQVVAQDRATHRRYPRHTRSGLDLGSLFRVKPEDRSPDKRYLADQHFAGK